MKFTPETYSIPDRPHQPFIDAEEIEHMLETADASEGNVRAVISKALSKNRLSMHDTAILLKTSDPALIEEIKSAARQLKQNVYGNRIVLFAPLYVGNYCMNNCSYCGFKASNRDALRMTLSTDELKKNVNALLDEGQKRLILVYGEHNMYDAHFIASTVRTVYEVHQQHANIRRVNINAAPLDHEGFSIVKEAGIGTYQIFQETYHPEAYKLHHPTGRKADFNWRLNAFDRAMEAGIDDVGLGALFGLYDWRFEVMGLLRHVNHLESCYNVGPHTISFPRLQDALHYQVDDRYRVSDEEFVRLIAILRLAVPYTGMILTAREPEHVRTQVLEFGCSQIDAGTRIGVGAYSEKQEVGAVNNEQFTIHDNRSLNEVMEELISKGYIPSFCTACYRKGRTGEHFMEFSIPGFIKRFCTPNGLLTLAEYLCDYAPEATAAKGWALIDKELEQLKESRDYNEVLERLQRIKNGERDLYF
jgi:2-iminoacetate synthase